MTLAVPLALGLLGLALPVVVAFLSSRRPRRVEVSSVEIFRILAEKKPAERSFRVLRHLLALLLTLLALLLVVLALTDPRAAWREPAAWVLVVDTSASMGAREPGQQRSRLERATDALEAFAQTLPADDRVALIGMGPTAEVLAGFTTRHDAVVEAARSLRAAGPSRGDTAAFALADSLCGGASDDAAIVVFSDGVDLTLAPTRCPVRHVAVGEPADNIGITALAAREADGFGLTEVFLGVDNAGAEGRSVSVDLLLDGKLLDMVGLEVPAGGHTERLVRMALPVGDVIEARLAGLGNTPDALAEDDAAWAPTRQGARVRGVLVTDRPGGFMAEALRLHPRLDLELVTPEGLSALKGPVDLLVLHATPRGPLPTARRILAVGADPTALGVAVVGDPVKLPEVIRWAFDEPLFRYVDLSGLQVASARLLTPPADGEGVILAERGALAVSTFVQGADAVVFGFDPARSDLVFRNAFVNLIANAVEWATPAAADLETRGLHTGERVPDLPADAELERADGSLTIGARTPVPTAGVWRVKLAGSRSGGVVTASLLSADDTSLAPSTLQGALPGVPTSSALSFVPWHWLLLAALAFVFVEWILPLVVSWFGRTDLRRPETPSDRRERRRRARRALVAGEHSTTRMTGT